MVDLKVCEISFYESTRLVMTKSDFGNIISFDSTQLYYEPLLF